MSRYTGLVMVAAVVLMVGLVASQERAPTQKRQDAAGPEAGPSTFAPDRMLVKIKDQAPADAIASVNHTNEGRLEEKIPHSRLSVVDIPDDLSVPEAVKRYEPPPRSNTPSRTMSCIRRRAPRHPMTPGSRRCMT